MVMPVLAVLAIEYPDYSPFLVGLAIGGYGLTQAILQIPMGVASDKFGRKPIIVAGLLMFAFGSWIAASADSLMWLTIGRFLQGAGAIAGAVMALAGDVSRESQRPKVMAIIGVSIGFSFYLALLLGPVIAKSHGLQGIFAITAVFALLCIPLVVWSVPNAKNIAPAGETLPVTKDLQQLFIHSKLARLNFGVCVLHLLITLLFVQLPGLLKQQGIMLEQQWSIYLPVLILSVVGMALLMRIAAKLGQARIILLSIGLLGLSLLGFWQFSNDYWGLMIVVWLFFTGFNYLEANFPALVSSIAPAGKKGSAMGIYASAQFLGAFLGGLISGLVQQYFVPQLIFIFAAILCVIWLIIMRGLGGTELLKRYTLSVNVSAQNADQLSQRLASLDGVHDITLLPEQNVAYLKVDNRQFDLRVARKVVNFED